MNVLSIVLIIMAVLYNPIMTTYNDYRAYEELLEDYRESLEEYNKRVNELNHTCAILISLDIDIEKYKLCRYSFFRGRDA